MSDIHGEYKAFAHVLRNGSGAVMKKIDDVFGDTLLKTKKKIWLHLFIIRQKNYSM